MTDTSRGLMVIAASALAFAAGCSSDSNDSAPAVFDVPGVITTTSSNVSPNGQNCSSEIGTLSAEDEVRVVNGSGELVGHTTLGIPKREWLDGGVMKVGNCTYSFTITGLPAGERFYEVTVGDQKLGTFEESEIRSGISSAF